MTEAKEQIWHLDDTENMRPFCGNCGKESYTFEAFRFCPFCGTPVIHTLPKKGVKK